VGSPTAAHNDAQIHQGLARSAEAGRQGGSRRWSIDVERWSRAALRARPGRDACDDLQQLEGGYRGRVAALVRLNYIPTPRWRCVAARTTARRPAGEHAMIKGSRFLEIEQAGYISNIEKPAIFKYRDGEAVR
jgi:hypothetical protein